MIISFNMLPVHIHRRVYFFLLGTRLILSFHILSLSFNLQKIGVLSLIFQKEDFSCAEDDLRIIKLSLILTKLPPFFNSNPSSLKLKYLI